MFTTIYQGLKIVWEHISKQPKVPQKYSAIFNALLIVWESGQTHSFMFEYYMNWIY